MRLRPTPTLIVTLLLALGTCYYYFGLLLPESRRQTHANAMGTQYSYGGDFYPIWLTGRALLMHPSDARLSDAHIRDPYTSEMTRQIQIGLYGRPMDPHRPTDPPPDYRAFSYPLYADLLAAPLLPFGFGTVRVVLSLLIVPLTAVSATLWLRAFRIQIPRSTLVIFIILTLVSYPVLEGLYALQTGLFVGAALALLLEALTRNRTWLSGILLAMASVKPQMVSLLAVFLLLWAASDWKRRKGFALGFLLTMALLCAASQILLPGWFFGWWHSLVTYSGYTLPPLPQLLLGRFVGFALSLALLALACVIGWQTRRYLAGSAGFSLCASLVLAVTAILLPTGDAVYDQVILLPAIFWLWSRRYEIARASRPVRVLALAALVALFWQWIMACAVALISLVSPRWAHSPAVLVFPTRMAASLPFVVTAILAFFAVKFLRAETYGSDAAREPATA